MDGRPHTRMLRWVAVGWGEQRDQQHRPKSREEKKKRADLGWVVSLLIQPWSQRLFGQRHDLILE